MKSGVRASIRKTSPGGMGFYTPQYAPGWQPWCWPMISNPEPPPNIKQKNNYYHIRKSNFSLRRSLPLVFGDILKYYGINKLKLIIHSIFIIFIACVELILFALIEFHRPISFLFCVINYVT